MNSFHSHFLFWEPAEQIGLWPVRKFLNIQFITVGLQYCQVPKNVSSKKGQAGISRCFKNMPGWKFEL